jgi:exodeoxyribonuclease VII small subunit
MSSAKQKKENGSRAIPADIAKMSFEEAYAALKTATDRLEGEEIDLESTLAEYGRASALARHCMKLLDSAEERIKVLTDDGGVIKLEPFQAGEAD